MTTKGNGGVPLSLYSAAQHDNTATKSGTILTVTPGTAGIYVVSSNMAIQAGATFGQAAMSVKKNGVEVFGGTVFIGEGEVDLWLDTRVISLADTDSLSYVLTQDTDTLPVNWAVTAQPVNTAP